jgi:hypothetical protein
MNVLENIIAGSYENYLTPFSRGSRYDAAKDVELQSKIGTISELKAFELAQKQKFDENNVAMHDAYLFEEKRLHDLFHHDLI